MAYLYKRNIDKPTPPLPATITTVDLSVPASRHSHCLNEMKVPAIGTDSTSGSFASKMEIPDLSESSHITFMSYDDYLRDIASMCKNDRMFMERMKTFWNDIVEDEKEDVEQSLPSTKPSCESGDGSK